MLILVLVNQKGRQLPLGAKAIVGLSKQGRLKA
jgi:hypothetical protein